MDYSPWSSKILIDRNQLKKFMQVGIDVTCMHTNFGGHGLSGFGDTATLKNGQICIHTNFGGCDFSGFGDIATSAIVHGHQKIQLFRIGMHISFAIHAALVRVSVRVGLKS